MTEYSLLIPFLDPSQRYCRGVELGMQIIAPMLNGKRVIRGYFRSRNEEQIRLAAHRMGYEVTLVKAWRFEGKRTGWVRMKLKKKGG